MDQPKIALVTDSASDLTKEQRAQYNIHMVSLRVLYRDGEYRDRIEIEPEQVYNRLSQEVPTTSLPLPGDVSALYDQLVAEGYTKVLHVCISSGLSGTCSMVRMVAAEYPQLNVEVIDSRTLSNGEGSLVLACGKVLKAGGSVEDALALVKKMRESQLGVFVIRTLEYLRKGGRIGLVDSVLGTMLNLKPIIFVNDDGIYQTLAKARGFTAALDQMLQEVRHRYEQRPIHLTVVHGQSAEEAQKLLERARQALNVAEGIIAQASPVLGVHTGPTLLGMVVNEATL